MARARIHIICGNCGCNDEWTWQIKKDGVDLDGENFEDDVYLICGNCATIHLLWDIMPKEGFNPKNHTKNTKLEQGE